MPPAEGTGPVVLFSEARFATADDRFYPEDPSSSDLAWAHYTENIEHFALAVRAHPGRGAVGSATHVTILPLPYYIGLRGAVAALPALLRSSRRAVREASGVVVRLPGVVGTVAALAARLEGVPYAAEVVGDIKEILTTIRKTKRMRAVAILASWMTRHVVSRASATRYVTRSVLQAKYPSAPGTPSFAVSSVRLPADAFVEQRQEPSTAQDLRLLSVGSQETTYKRHDLSLTVLSMLQAAGLPASLTLVGDGRTRPELEGLAESLGVAHHVSFLSSVGDSSALRGHLDAAHVLIHPSDTEGLPRVVIEAMARGLPVVATDVGGVRELLDGEHLSSPGDATGLYDAVCRLLVDPRLRAAVSERNLTVARAYSDECSRQSYAAWCRLVGEMRSAVPLGARPPARLRTSRESPDGQG